MEDALAAIRRLYYAATPATIGRDLARAVALLKAMAGEEERERATVFMEGLAEMRREWAHRASRGSPSRKPGTGSSAAGGGKTVRKR